MSCYEDCDCDRCCARRMALREAQANECDECEDMNDAMLAYGGKIRIIVWAKPDKDVHFVVKMNLGGWQRGDTYRAGGDTMQEALTAAIDAARSDGWEI